MYSVFRLQAELKEKDTDHVEAIKTLETKLGAEIQNLKELLATSEATNTAVQKEVSKKKIE